MHTQRNTHLALDTSNTLVIPRPQHLNIHIPLPSGFPTPIKFKCDLEGQLTEGTIDTNGNLQIPNAHLASSGLLEVWCFGDEEEPFKWSLELDTLIAADSIEGLQSRLNNLGYKAGPVDGIIGKQTKAAIRNFQQTHNLTVDGQAGPQMAKKLESIHGC